MDACSQGCDIMTDPQTAGERPAGPLQASTEAIGSEMLEPSVAPGPFPPYEVLLGGSPSGGLPIGSDGEV